MTDETLESEVLEQETSENVELTDEADSPDSTQDETTDEPDTAAKPKQSGFQKRIDALTREKYEAQAQAQFYAEQLRVKEQADAPKDAPKPVDSNSPPKADDFDTYEDYLDALTDYKTDQKLAARLEADKAREADNSKAQAQQAKVAAAQTMVAKGREKYEDFDQVALSGGVPITQEMAEAVADSDMGADLAYYLGSNPAEAAEIAKMPLAASLRALGRIEAKLEQSPIQSAEKSKAPAPIKPVAKGAKASADPNSMSIDEWMEWRRKQVS